MAGFPLSGNKKRLTRFNGGVRQNPSAQTNNGDRAVQRFMDCTDDQRWGNNSGVAGKLCECRETIRQRLIRERIDIVEAQVKAVELMR